MCACRKEEYAQILQGTENTQITAWWDKAADIIPLNCGKGNAVNAVLNYYGLSKDEAIAFGDGRNDIEMLEADIERGGMIDGNGIQVVKFPDDGHPTMCAEAVNLYGDARDEIVTWDYDSMYIYTQDDAPKDDVYAPFKYPDYNA